MGHLWVNLSKNYDFGRKWRKIGGIVYGIQCLKLATYLEIQLTDDEEEEETTKNNEEEGTKPCRIFGRVIKVRPKSQGSFIAFISSRYRYARTNIPEQPGIVIHHKASYQLLPRPAGISWFKCNTDFLSKKKDDATSGPETNHQVLASSLISLSWKK